jgi:hypothetical protein
MGHIYIEVELKGTKAERKIKMFVDTGATRTNLDYTPPFGHIRSKLSGRPWTAPLWLDRQG